MERLTKRNGKYVEYSDKNYNDSVDNYTMLDKCLHKLADYEDEEEQGLLLRLPCKIGDIVYFIKPICNSDYNICDGSCKTCADYVVSEIEFELGMLNRLGEFYFITKEEAEQKLAELYNK